ncbi:MAG: T9SS type A sorting domain-containing protein [Bacteroidota bacterium]|nr:T9SS type A sorting domain-containing protein [Bacteroidota bacterium]
MQVAPGNSSSADDAIASFPFTFEPDQMYIVVANGIVSETGYSPAPAFNLDVFAQGRNQATNQANTDILVHHGSTDAPVIDIVEVGAGVGTIVDNIEYSNFAGYLELPTNNYVLEVKDETGATTLASFDAPLATLELQGAAIVVVASGFINPEDNSNGAPFGLFAAMSKGGNLVALPVSAPSSISEITKDKISFFPNPAKGILTINFSDLQVNEINLIDITGKSLLTIIPNMEASLDLKNLPSGTYFVKITTDQTTIVEKVSVIK